MKTYPGLFLVFAIAILFLFGSSLFAQPPGLPGSPEQAPVDGGLALLAAAGGAYALKKLKNRRE